MLFQALQGVHGGQGLAQHLPLSHISKNDHNQHTVCIHSVFLRQQERRLELYTSHDYWCRTIGRTALRIHGEGSSKLNIPTAYGGSVRSLPIRLISVGKSRSPGTHLLVEQYSSKIKRYCPFEELQLRPNPKNSPEAHVQILAEGERVLRSLNSRDFVVVLDERGKKLNSEQFASLIASAGESAASAIVVCVGGPYGHGDAVRQRADCIVCLSSMVLNHEVALVVAMEQLYRAWTILRGEKYHH